MSITKTFAYKVMEALPPDFSIGGRFGDGYSINHGRDRIGYINSTTREIFTTMLTFAELMSNQGFQMILVIDI